MGTDKEENTFQKPINKKKNRELEKRIEILGKMQKEKLKEEYEIKNDKKQESRKQKTKSDR